MNNKNSVVKLGKEEKLEDSSVLKSITLWVVLIALCGKILTFGWATIVFSWLILLHFFFFAKVCLKLANKEKKTKFDYRCFKVLCITLLVYVFTFVDVGDTSSNKFPLFVSISDGVLSTISSISLFVNVVLIIIISVREFNGEILDSKHKGLMIVITIFSFLMIIYSRINNFTSTNSILDLIIIFYHCRLFVRLGFSFIKDREYVGLVTLFIIVALYLYAFVISLYV